ncbi:hypothetical protein BKA70DRAFT_1370619 [Coprinopsis sp. MPI-PUGE-AT-0042]|nr:hypothetical protein BKA70DRAFT_1370619 [Coprinopsis sp. MPI-PUGE-AT-0042]
MLGLSWVALSLLAVSANAGRVVWDGTFNNFASSSDFDKWSWGNQVGTYQWYIHGNLSTSRYLNVDAAYKNPAQTNEQRGLKLTIDTTATWNSQMERAELIPQTTANLGTGNLFYTTSQQNTLEHQVMFFESHFTELKYGLGSNPSNLGWYVGGVEKWSTPFTADTWFNFAYDINFSSKTVGLYASTNGSPLVRVAQNIAANTFTDSRDFHVGVLRIVNRNPQEDWYFSGVYIEEGPITTAIGSGSSPGTSDPVTSAPWGQCGGTGYSGPTTCTSGSSCVAVSPPYYYQVSSPGLYVPTIG